MTNTERKQERIAEKAHISTPPPGSKHRVYRHELWDALDRANLTVRAAERLTGVALRGIADRKKHGTDIICLTDNKKSIRTVIWSIEMFGHYENGIPRIIGTSDAGEILSPSLWLGERFRGGWKEPQKDL